MEMTDKEVLLLVFFSLSFLLWLIVFVLFRSMRNLQKRATAETVGKVVGNRTFRSGKSVGVKTEIAYWINGELHKREFQVNRLWHVGKIPLGQRRGLPEASEVLLRFDPTEPRRIFVVVDNHFTKKFLMFFFGSFAAFLLFFAILLTQA